MLLMVAAHSGMDDEAWALVGTVVGRVNHRAVRVELFQAFEPGSRQFWVTVRDEETRALVATGYPAESAERALEEVHWRGVRSGEGW